MRPAASFLSGGLLMIVLAVALAAGKAGAAPPDPSPIPTPTPPAPRQPSVISGRVSALQPLPRGDDFRIDRSGAWKRIQPDLDRSTGRIVDEPTYQLDRLDALRRARNEPFDPSFDFRLFQEDRDRWLRIDDRQLAQERAARRSVEQQRNQRMQLKEYELMIDAGMSSAVGAQAESDRNALQAARNQRDEALKSAGNDAAARKQIEDRFQRERARILGFDGDITPATQPVQPP